MHRAGSALGFTLAAALLILPGRPAADGGTAAPATLRPDQISTFARMVGASEAEVASRLAQDDQLRAVVLQGLEAREVRRASVKSRAVAGFVILGVGGAIGAITVLSTPVNEDGTSSNPDRVLLGAVISAASTGLGLAIAIPALASGGRQGPEELAAGAAYRKQVLPTPAPERPAPTTGRAVTFPVLALTF